MKRFLLFFNFYFFLTSFTLLNAQWAKVYGGPARDRAYSIIQTGDGGFVVAGFTESFGAGDFDVFVLKLDANGDISPSCELIGSTDCAISYESILPVETLVSP